ncbi:MAG: carboxypeptidase regulatory-like domain-containing protein [Oscillatoriales cyanobacterium C42_A2020_001]|nr:carboxypeptidase regulatory-like domain-containing protein [Leptolyngbyaceae cyanobacterium C42_A2020_001]
MKSTGSIEGIIRDTAQSPLAEVNVMIVSGLTHADIAAITDTTGTFGFGNLRPGFYSLKAFGNAVESDRISVQVLPGKVAFVEIILETDSACCEDQVVDEI